MQLPGLRDQTPGRLTRLEESEVVKSLSLLLVADTCPPEKPVEGTVVDGSADGTARNLVVLCGTDGCEANALWEGERERERCEGHYGVTLTRRGKGNGQNTEE